MKKLYFVTITFLAFSVFILSCKKKESTEPVDEIKSKITGLELVFDKSYGVEDKQEDAKDIMELPDGGFLIIGTRAVDFLKVDADGNQQWTKDTDWYPAGVFKTGGNEMFTCGTLYSWQGGYPNYYVSKVGNAGDVSDFYSETKKREPYYVDKTSDGGYIFAGATSKDGGQDVGDLWISKRTATGESEWEEIIDDANYEGIYYVKQTADGGYFVAGYKQHDEWFGKFSADGELTWDEKIAGNELLDYRVIDEGDDSFLMLGGDDWFAARVKISGASGEITLKEDADIDAGDVIKMGAQYLALSQTPEGLAITAYSVDDYSQQWQKVYPIGSNFAMYPTKLLVSSTNRLMVLGEVQETGNSGSRQILLLKYSIQSEEEK